LFFWPNVSINTHTKTSFSSANSRLRGYGWVFCPTRWADQTIKGFILVESNTEMNIDLSQGISGVSDLPFSSKNNLK